METLIIDLRYALRHLRKRPAYALLWIGTLTLGIGGTAAIGSVLNAFLNEPLPYAAEERLVQFWAPFDWSEAEHAALRPDYPGFSAVSAYANEPLNLRRDGEPARVVDGVMSSYELFEVLGARPELGRLFAPGEDLHPAPARVAVISHRLWMELGGRRTVLESTLELDGWPYEVVGVMPAGFWFPRPSVDVWIPAGLDPENRSGNYAMVARAAGSPSGPDADLQPHLQAIAGRLAERFEYPLEWDKTKEPTAVPLREVLLGESRPMLLATQLAMLAILLMAAANVTSLMLGQIGRRGPELGVRAAMGASRLRIASQILLECLILGIFAGFLAGGASLVIHGLLLNALPVGPLTTAVADFRVPLLAMGLSLLVSALIAVIPIVKLWRGRHLENASSSGRGELALRGGRLEAGLVVAEIAVAVLLATGAGLLVRSAANLAAVGTGIDTERVAVLQTSATGSGETGRNAQRLLSVERLEQLANQVPGVESAALVQRLPLSGGGWSTWFAVENREGFDGATTYYRMVTPDYHETMGVRLLEGRRFRAADTLGDEAVTIVNQALVERYFPDEDPIGLRIALGIGDGWARIIGVAENEAVAGLTDEPAPARYVLYHHLPFTPESNNLLVRTRDDVAPAAVLPAVRAALERDAPEVAIQRSTTMETIRTEAMGQAPRLLQVLLLLGALGLVLGMVGVYGVINHYVVQRSSEWSLRLALGLSPGDVFRFVLRRGAVLIMGGLVLGVVAAQGLAHLLTSLLYGVERSDPLTTTLALLLLGLAGIAAAALPAARAGRSHPGELLRR